MTVIVDGVAAALTRVGQEFTTVRGELAAVAGRAGGVISNVSLDADITVAAPPAAGDGDVRRYRYTASGATRRVTFAPEIVPTTGLVDAYDVPAGQTLIAAVEWVSPRSAWLLIAATVG